MTVPETIIFIWNSFFIVNNIFFSISAYDFCVQFFGVLVLDLQLHTIEISRVYLVGPQGVEPSQQQKQKLRNNAAEHAVDIM